MKPKLLIDGVDFTWVLPEGGIQWSRNDIDTSKSGRSLVSAEMHRSRLAVKRKLVFSKCRRMTTAQLKSLNDALFPPTVSVTVLDPLEGGYRTAVFYGSSVEATTQIYDAVSDETYWDNTSFSLVEV